MENRICISVIVSITIFLILSLFATVLPNVYDFYADRQHIFDKKSAIFDVWNSKPLLQQRKYYFYNVTNSDDLNNPGMQMKIHKVGPFTYNVKEGANGILMKDPESMNYLSYSDLNFVPSNSVSDESSTICFLNFTCINKDCSSDQNEQKMYLKSETFKARSRVFQKWTVKEILRSIIYNHNFSSVQSKLPGLNFATDKSYAFNKNVQEKDSETHSSKAEKFSNVLDFFRVINTTFYNDKLTLDVLEKIPFRCVMIVGNGTEFETKTHPKYYDVSTQKFILLWNKDICLETKNKDVSPELHKDTTDLPEMHFKSKSRIFFDSSEATTDSSLWAHFNMEPISSIVTSFSLRYELKIESESIDSGNIKNNSYPFVRIEIFGKSTPQIDALLYKYIAFPKIFLYNILPKMLLFSSCFLVASAAVIYILIFYESETEDEDEAIPLLTFNNKTITGSRRINTYI